MSLIMWNDSMSVGIKSIDDQHKKFIDILNELYDSMQAKKERETLSSILDDLLNHTVEHFKYEEDLFAKTGYAGAYEHISEHEDLKKKAMEIKSRFDASVTGTLSLEVMNFLRGWLQNHIQDTDKKYTDCLVSKGIT